MAADASEVKGRPHKRRIVAVDGESNSAGSFTEVLQLADTVRTVRPQPAPSAPIVPGLAAADAPAVNGVAPQQPHTPLSTHICLPSSVFPQARKLCRQAFSSVTPIMRRMMHLQVTVTDLDSLAAQGKHPKSIAVAKMPSLPAGLDESAEAKQHIERIHERAAAETTAEIAKARRAEMASMHVQIKQIRDDCFRNLTDIINDSARSVSVVFSVKQSVSVGLAPMDVSGESKEGKAAAAGGSLAMPADGPAVGPAAVPPPLPEWVMLIPSLIRHLESVWEREVDSQCVQFAAESRAKAKAKAEREAAKAKAAKAEAKGPFSPDRDTVKSLVQSMLQQELKKHRFQSAAGAGPSTGKRTQSNGRHQSSATSDTSKRGKNQRGRNRSRGTRKSNGSEKKQSHKGSYKGSHKGSHKGSSKRGRGRGRGRSGRRGRGGRGRGRGSRKPSD